MVGIAAGGLGGAEPLSAEVLLFSSEVLLFYCKL